MFNFIVRHYGPSLIYFIMPPYFIALIVACHYTQNVAGLSGRMQLAEHLRSASTYSLKALEEVLGPKIIRKVEKPGNRRYFKSTNSVWNLLLRGLISNYASLISTVRLASQEKNRKTRSWF